MHFSTAELIQFQLPTEEYPDYLCFLLLFNSRTTIVHLLSLFSSKIDIFHLLIPEDRFLQGSFGQILSLIRIFFAPFQYLLSQQENGNIGMQKVITIVFFCLCKQQNQLMSHHIHNQLMDHYRARRSLKESKSSKVQSIVKQTILKKVNQEDSLSPFEDFLRIEEHVASDSHPLQFRELPRNLKCYFPGPPQAPTSLPEIPYTYEIVPKVAYKIPKQKRGTVGSWVLEDSGFVSRRQKSVVQQKGAERVLQAHKDMTQKKKIFRKAIKKLASKMREENLSLKQIQKNKGMVKKPFNYYNSKDFFVLVKAGDKEAEGLLEANPYLAFDVDEFKMTALHWTAREGHAYLTKTLLQKFRANTGAKDMYGRTPLHLAVAKKQIPCIIRIFIQGGQLNILDIEKRSVRSIAPDAYTKYLLQKLQEVKFIIRARGIKDVTLYRQELQKHVKFVLDQASLYF